MTSLLLQPNKAHQQPEARVTPVVIGCCKHGNTNANKEQAKAGTVDDSEMLKDNYDERLNEPGQRLEDQEGSEEGDVDRETCLNIHRMPFCPPAEDGLISEK